MTIVYILSGLLVFGVLIAVHELGHFLAAKACGVQVNEFSIGMGPAIWHKETGETQYSLRALPIGGFCAMEGENEESDNPRALNRQGFWKKLLIFAAGSIMNFLAGVIIIAILYAGAGAFLTDQITGFAPDFPLQGEEGLMVGDRIYSVDGYRTYLSGDASLFLSYNKGEGIDMEVIRDGEKITLKDLPMYRQTYTGMEGEEYQGFGLYVGQYAEEATLGVRLKYVWYTALDFAQLARFGLVQLVTGGAGFQDLGGPVAIVSTIVQVGEASEEDGAAAVMESILYLAALIAINLAVMNLLPIPALDGGHIFFLLLDAVTMTVFKKKIPEKYESAITTACFFALMAFMVLVTFQDIFKLFQ